jgi:ribosomal protein L11 methyltransferase
VQGLLQGRTVLDFGCGSGILALAALLGAAQAIGVDNDPQALVATGDNAERNGVQPHLPRTCPTTNRPAPIRWWWPTSSPRHWMRWPRLLAARVAPGGRIALSGILHGQEGELLERYAAWFDELRTEQDGDWMRIDGVRR